MAKMLAEQGKPPEAIPHFNAALQTWPDNVALRHGLAKALAS